MKSKIERALGVARSVRNYERLTARLNVKPRLHMVFSLIICLFRILNDFTRCVGFNFVAFDARMGARSKRGT